MSLWDLIKLTFYAADLFSQQEKLAKSIHYLISKEDQVRTQITDLEQLISQTEVRELSHAATTPTSFSLQKDVLFSLQKCSSMSLYFMLNSLMHKLSFFPFFILIFLFFLSTKRSDFSSSFYCFFHLNYLILNPLLLPSKCLSHVLIPLYSSFLAEYKYLKRPSQNTVCEVRKQIHILFTKKEGH